MHEKGLQIQKGVGTLVSSQERRALAVPLINRLSTAGQPRVNRGSTVGQPLISFLHRFTSDFVCSCFRRDVQDSVFDSLGRRGRVVPWPDLFDGVVSYPAPPPSPPRRAPPRPDRPVVCPGFGFDRWTSSPSTFSTSRKKKPPSFVFVFRPRPFDHPPHGLSCPDIGIFSAIFSFCR